MLICIQWHIYLQWYVANMHVEVGMQQANGADCRPQYTPTCLESSDCSRSSRWMQKSNFEAFSCRHFNFKNSAPECTRTRHFHSEKWKIFWGGAQPLPQWEEDTPSGTHSLGTSTLGLHYKILDTPLDKMTQSSTGTLTIHYWNNLEFSKLFKACKSIK